MYKLILKDESFYYIDKIDFLEYKKYDWLDIHKEFIKMEEWCKSNKSKRKTRRGVARFITNWLNNAKPEPVLNKKEENPRSTRDRSLLQDLTDTSWANEFK